MRKMENYGRKLNACWVNYILFMSPDCTFYQNAQSCYKIITTKYKVGLFIFTVYDIRVH